jgi:hypothetical protein
MQTAYNAALHNTRAKKKCLIVLGCQRAQDKLQGSLNQQRKTPFATLPVKERAARVWFSDVNVHTYTTRARNNMIFIFPDAASTRWKFNLELMEAFW